MTGDIYADLAALSGREAVTNADRLIGDLGLDSLALAELTAMLEDYGIGLPASVQDDPGKWRELTVGQLLQRGS